MKLLTEQNLDQLRGFFYSGAMYHGLPVFFMNHSVRKGLDTMLGPEIQKTLLEYDSQKPELLVLLKILSNYWSSEDQDVEKAALSDNPSESVQRSVALYRIIQNPTREDERGILYLNVLWGVTEPFFQGSWPVYLQDIERINNPEFEIYKENPDLLKEPFIFIKGITSGFKAFKCKFQDAPDIRLFMKFPYYSLQYDNSELFGYSQLENVSQEEWDSLIRFQRQALKNSDL